MKWMRRGTALVLAFLLSVAVLAILITAPLGAIGMDATYQKLLEKQL
mgnify:CR=1 FL=1